MVAIIILTDKKQTHWDIGKAKVDEKILNRK